MERLTEYMENGKIHLKDLDKAMVKLAEFEDFMEEQGFESLEQLKKYINDLYAENIVIATELSLTKAKNKKVQDRWSELKDYVDRHCIDRCAMWKIRELEKEQDDERSN